MLLRLVLERLLLLLRLHARWLVDDVLVYVVNVKAGYSQVLSALSRFMTALGRNNEVGVPREDLGEGGSGAIAVVFERNVQRDVE